MDCISHSLIIMCIIFSTDVFEYHPAECDPGDEEAEMDDDPVLDTG